MTIDELLRTPTKEAVLERLIAQLAGRGWVRHDGVGLGTVELVSGTPLGDYDIVLKVVTTGTLGTGVVQISTDLGATFGANTTIPSNGTLLLPGTGVTAQFTTGPGATSTTDFVVGDTFNAEVRRSGFPVTSWQPFSTARSLVENDAEAMADLYQLVEGITRGGYLKTAEGRWLDLFAESFYGLSRSQGTFTTGSVVLTDATGQGPFTKQPGEIIVATAGGLRFVNLNAVTIPLSGSVTATMKAESAGAAYNVANGTIVAVLSSLPGVTSNNPDPGSGTWLLTQAVDIESDELLRQRCSARWPALGTGTTASVYESWAKEASTSVTKATARVGTVPGTVTLVLAGNGGGVAGPVVTAVNDYLETRQPLAISVIVSSAASLAVTVTGDVFVGSALVVQATAEASLALQQLIADTPIGGTLYLSAIIEAIMSASGVRNVVLSAPVADVALTTLQVATLTQSLTFIGV